MNDVTFAHNGPYVLQKCWWEQPAKQADRTASGRQVMERTVRTATDVKIQNRTSYSN